MTFLNTEACFWVCRVWLHRSSIHDHTDSHCFLKLLQGQLKETLFDWPDRRLQGGMVQKSQRVLLEDQCAYINGENHCRLWAEAPLTDMRLTFTALFQTPSASIAWRTSVTRRAPSACTSTVLPSRRARRSTSALDTATLSRWPSGANMARGHHFVH